jgi:hypothetical protein
VSPSFADIDQFLMATATTKPLLIVYVVGLVLALTTWRSHPRASLLSLIAFLMLFLVDVLTSYLSVLSIPQTPGPMGGFGVGVAFLLADYVLTAISILAWGLLLFALFARRPLQPDGFIDVRERYPRQFPERDAPPGPSSQDIRT